jgi:hypothetical protein
MEEAVDVFMKQLRETLLRGDRPSLLQSLRSYAINPANEATSWGVIYELAQDMTPETFWFLFHRLYTGVFVDPVQCVELFKRFRAGHTPELMTDKNRLLYVNIPDQFSIYRGQDNNRGRSMSWSASRQIASFYGSNPSHVSPVLITARIKRGDVCALFEETGEYEIIPWSPDDLDATTIPVDHEEAERGFYKIQRRRAALLQQAVLAHGNSVTA